MADEMKTKLLHDDCIRAMQQLDEGSIDLTVTSPPYDNLRTYEGSLEWNEDIWKQVLEQLYRVTKQGGVVVWVVGDATIKGSETGTSFKQALYAKEIGFNLHDTMIYEKAATGACGSNYACWQAFEYMFIFSKGKPNAVNRIRDVKNKLGGSIRPCVKNSERGERAGIKVKEFGIRSNIWRFTVGFASKGGRGIKHPAKFPLQLATDHIRSWSNEGDTVLDPFMGSGTTGIACKDLNRNFVGIEKVEKYFKICKKRIDG